MHFMQWEPLYKEILDDFGFSRKHDEEAALFLSGLLENRQDDALAQVESLIRGRRAVVCGNAPSLAAELSGFRDPDAIIIAADGATSVLLSTGIVPQIIVTDLDGFLPDIIKADELGSIVVVHAHGDNIDKLKEYVPQMKHVLGTTQAGPLDRVHSFGGFTDGDRCVFLAVHFGAASVRLLGFDFDDETVTPRKKKKLLWARRLVDLALRERN